jgi:C4-dicarboxylate-binding protein DctP
MKPFNCLFGAFAVLASAVVAVVPVLADEPIVIKFSHVVTDNAPKGKAALKFKELAEKYTNGKVKVEVYPNSTLYKGAVQMLAPSTAKFAPLGVKEYEVLDLPFLFPDQASYDRVMGGEFGRMMFKKLEAKGIRGLAYWDNGFYMLSANRPLVHPDDMHGLKIRISGSKVDEDTMRTLGALPQIMAFSELYQALASGVVDGAQNSASNYTTQKLPEVQKYFNTLYHVHLEYAVIVNKKFWDAVPDDIRTQLEQAIKEATDYNNTISLQENATALTAIRASSKSDVHDPTPQERGEWIKATESVYKSAEKRVGKAIIDEALAATHGD